MAVTLGVSDFSRSYLRTRATRVMQDACVITRPGANKVTYDPNTRQVVVNGGTAVYTGPCRLWQVSGGGVTTQQDREVIIVTTYLSVPFEAVPEMNDIVTMTASKDAELVGRALAIQGVTKGGGLRGSRVMSVVFVDYEEEEL